MTTAGEQKIELHSMGSEGGKRTHKLKQRMV
jgi:hypothetical protein